MVYIVVKTFYPSHIREEVNARYLEMLQKFPPDNTIAELVVPIAAKVTKEGIEVMSVQLVKEGKFDEAFKRTGATLVMFQDIEGYESSTEVWATLEEAQAMAV